MRISLVRSAFLASLLILSWLVVFLLLGPFISYAQSVQPEAQELVNTTLQNHIDVPVILAQAANPPASGAPGPGANPPGTGVPGGPAAPATGSGRLANPLSNITTIPDLLAAILNVVIIIAIPIIILFIMFAGFQYVTANGNAKKVQDASRALLYAVIGGILIIGATAIAQIIRNLVNAFTAA